MPSTRKKPVVTKIPESFRDTPPHALTSNTLVSAPLPAINQPHWPSATRNLLFDTTGQISNPPDASPNGTNATAAGQSDDILQRFIDHAPVAIAMFDRSMHYLAASRRWLHDHGLKGQNVIGRSHYDIFPDLPGRWKSAHQRGLAGEVLREEKDIYQRADGTTRWLRWELQPWRDSAGNIGGIVIFVEDLTERVQLNRQAEDALRASHERLSKVLAVETVGVMFWDLASGAMIDANDTFLKIMGYSRREVEARELTWQKLTPPEYLEVSRAELRKFAATGRVGPYEKEYFRKDGSRQWFVFAGSRLEQDTAVEFCVDISDRKLAEARLRETKEQIQYFIDNTKDILFQIDLNGNYTFGNAAAERVTGYPLAQLLRMNMRELVAPEFHALVTERLQSRILGGPEEKNFEFQIRHKDGHRLWLELTTSSVFNEAGRLTAIQGVARDITERKQSENLLRQANRTLRAIRDCHEAMLRAETEPALLNEICRIIVEIGGERMAWVGYAEHNKQKNIKVVASSGGKKYLTGLRVSWADTPRGRGPTGTAVRTGKACLCQNTQTDPGFAPWRESARRHGFGSTIALPLIVDGRCIGALAIYAQATDAFDTGEQLLLADLANDLSFGIAALRLRAERTRLEDEILKSIEREQERIGRDLHDGLCQLLVGAKFRCGYLQGITAKELAAAREEARTLEAILNTGIAQARNMARGLNPVNVTPTGLSSALQRLAEDTTSLGHPGCVCKFFGSVKISDHHTANHLYRIAQEALQNALKHSGAKNITITLEKRVRNVVLSIKDDGVGMPAQVKEAGMGLSNMRMRASLIGGRLEISRRKSGGTKVGCEFNPRNHVPPTKHKKPSASADHRPSSRTGTTGRLEFRL